MSYDDAMAAARARVSEITPEDASVMQERAHFIDVREPPETIAGGVIEGARLLPLSEWQEGINLEDLRDRPIVIYCAHGNRSILAALALEQAGFRQVMSMSGGIEQWTAEGRPVTRVER